MHMCTYVCMYLVYAIIMYVLLYSRGGGVQGALRIGPTIFNI